MRLTPIKKDHLIEKKNVLNEMRSYNMKLQELRFFSIYLSKINPRDLSTRLVRFPLSEFERIMELVRVQAKDIKPVVDSLLCKIVHIPTKNGGFTAFQLFKECKVDHGEDGVWYVEIDAHDKALPLMFEFKDHYFKYELWNALRLTSSNHLRMYEILKQYEKMGERTFKIDELRSLLGIEKKEYPRWDRFQDRVLNSCQNALAEKTDLKFSYEPLRCGRKFTAIKFKIEKNTDYIDQLTLAEFIDEQDEEEEAVILVNKYEKHLELLAEACNSEFTNAEMQVIFNFVVIKIPYDSGKSLARLDIDRFEWLKIKYDELNARADRPDLSPLKNRFIYFKKVLEEQTNENY